MGGRKQRKNKNIQLDINEAFMPSNHSAPARNMRKTDLGAVIFGCKHDTIHECLSNQLFGLPASHYSYIKNISPGLVLFLFNYSDRKLYGIFEAASPGQMNINRYAWVADGDDRGYTKYPAQVRIRVRQQCKELAEKDFRPIIADNYYEVYHFYFELDRDQTNKLIMLFTSSPKNNLSRSLPAKEKAENADEMTNLLEPAVGNLNQTSGLSYASVLGRNSNTTLTATSAQPPQTWNALLRTQSDFEVSNDDDMDKEAERNYDEDFDELPSSSTHPLDAILDVKRSLSADSNEDNVEELEEQDNPLMGNLDVNQSWSADSNEDDVEEIVEKDSPLVGNLDVKQSLSSDSNEDDVEETEEKDNPLVLDTEMSSNLDSLAVKLMQEVELLKGSQLKQTMKLNLLEQELHESKLEIQQLRNRLGALEIGSEHIVDPAEVIGHRSWFSESVFIVGGYDGSSWLPTLDSFFPSHDIKKSLSPMKFVKKYASAATFNGELYHFGGMGSHTVESFIPTKNQWVSRPPLHWKNIHVAGASINGRLFVVGGANGRQCSSEVEYLDLNIGSWRPTHSMQSKRFAPAAAELNNALYVAGGYDGHSYLSSVERFDPREEAWCKLPSMNTRKGCHSMIVLNEKLYTVGGFDGDKYVATVETLDTRMCLWVETEPMKVARGNFGAFVLGETLYAIGGLKENNEVLDNVECYKEGRGWVVADLKAVGKRSQFSAIVM